MGVGPYRAAPPVPTQSIGARNEEKCGPYPAFGDAVGTSSAAAFSAGDDPAPEDPSPAPPTAPADTPPPPPPPPSPPPFPSVYNVEMVLVSGGVTVGSNDEVRVRSDGPETIIGVQASGWP